MYSNFIRRKIPPYKISWQSPSWTLVTPLYHHMLENFFLFLDFKNRQVSVPLTKPATAIGILAISQTRIGVIIIKEILHSFTYQKKKKKRPVCHEKHFIPS